MDLFLLPVIFNLFLFPKSFPDSLNVFFYLFHSFLQYSHFHFLLWARVSFFFYWQRNKQFFVRWQVLLYSLYFFLHHLDRFLQFFKLNTYFWFIAGHCLKLMAESQLERDKRFHHLIPLDLLHNDCDKSWLFYKEVDRVFEKEKCVEESGTGMNKCRG